MTDIPTMGEPAASAQKDGDNDAPIMEIKPSFSQILSKRIKKHFKKKKRAKASRDAMEANVVAELISSFSQLESELDQHVASAADPASLSNLKRLSSFFSIGSAESNLKKESSATERATSTLTGGKANLAIPRSEEQVSKEKMNSRRKKKSKKTSTRKTRKWLLQARKAIEEHKLIQLRKKEAALHTDTLDTTNDVPCPTTQKAMDDPEKDTEKDLFAEAQSVEQVTTIYSGAEKDTDTDLFAESESVEQVTTIGSGAEKDADKDIFAEAESVEQVTTIDTGASHQFESDKDESQDMSNTSQNMTSTSQNMTSTSQDMMNTSSSDGYSTPIKESQEEVSRESSTAVSSQVTSTSSMSSTYEVGSNYSNDLLRNEEEMSKIIALNYQTTPMFSDDDDEWSVNSMDLFYRFMTCQLWAAKARKEFCDPPEYILACRPNRSQSTQIIRRNETDLFEL